MHYKHFTATWLGIFTFNLDNRDSCKREFEFSTAFVFVQAQSAESPLSGVIRMDVPAQSTGTRNN